jgi:hypothetical protein
MSDPRKIIDYAMDGEASKMRDELYSTIYDKVNAHIEVKKQEIARNLVGQYEEPEYAEPEQQEQ